uniref:Uncharacterized protein n=1 Tax=Oryza brachyantha TaxID=4533 RepID=J3MX19_ORYBR
MGASTPRHHLSSQPLPLLTKRIFTYALYALLPLAVLHYLLFSPRPPAPPPLAAVSSPPHGDRTLSVLRFLVTSVRRRGR